jgi:hypothetical protein
MRLRQASRASALSVGNAFEPPRIGS